MRALHPIPSGIACRCSWGFSRANRGGGRTDTGPTLPKPFAAFGPVDFDRAALTSGARQHNDAPPPFTAIPCRRGPIRRPGTSDRYTHHGGLCA